VLTTKNLHHASHHSQARLLSSGSGSGGSSGSGICLLSFSTSKAHCCSVSGKRKPRAEEKKNEARMKIITCDLIAVGYRSESWRLNLSWRRPEAGLQDFESFISNVGKRIVIAISDCECFTLFIMTILYLIGCGTM
jgi:hypothetical protein